MQTVVRRVVEQDAGSLVAKVRRTGQRREEDGEDAEEDVGRAHVGYSVYKT